MTQISRKYDFQDGTIAIADQVDAEFNQLIEEHNILDLIISTHLAKQVDPSSTDDIRDKHVSNLDMKAINDQLEDIYTGGLDSRYYPKEELEPYLSGGDTIIQEEVFTILDMNTGGGTFTYKDKDGNILTGPIDAEGNQTFELQTGFYQLNANRIHAVLNDSVRRSVTSGGLIEVDSTHIAITPQPTGMEITFVYFQRIGVTGEHNVIVGNVQPPQGDDNTLWFKVVG